MRLSPSLLSLLTFLLIAPTTITAAILAIDYGSEFTKLSLVKPGVPFDVLLDKDSKRKISSVVGWKRDDRAFGQEAKMAVTRFPDTHYPYVKPLLSSSVLPTMPIYPNPPTLLPDGTLIFPHPSLPSHIHPQPPSSDAVWTPTALLAHQLSYYRSLAESMAKPDIVTQAIVTVPAWWTQAQRRSYRDALELAGLSCLAMIGEGTGVGLNYAMTRNFPNYDPETGIGQREFHVVYDSGALQTTATVLAFYQTSYLPSPKSKTLINTTHIEVLGVGWEEIGGVQLDLAVQEILVKDFIEKTGLEDVRQDKKAMAKLAKEAVRVKHILSANQESSVAIESLFNDRDYRSHVSRSSLEEIMTSSSMLFTNPINSALTASNLSLSSISSVILFGGNSRVPFVQTAIRSVLGPAEDRIAQNVNTDEAAVLGAAFYGAALSKQFKMKSMKIEEGVVYDVTVDGELFWPKGSKLGQKKSLTLPPKDKINLTFAENGVPILDVSIPDVATPLANFTSPSPIVNVTMRIDNRGLVSTANVVLTSNEGAKDGGVAGALKGLFGGKKEKTEEESAEEPTEVIKAEKLALKFKETVMGSRPLISEEKRTIQARLQSISTYEAAMTAREEARNMLEGYLYRLSNLMNDDTENQAVLEFSTPAEREPIRKLLEETFEWLNEEAERANVTTLLAKRSAIEALEQPIIVRFNEYRTRPKAIEDFQKAMFAGRAFLVEARQNVSNAKLAQEQATPESPVAPPKFTDAELDDVEALLKEYEIWMDGLMNIQVTIEEDKTKDPVIFTKDLDERGRKLQSTVMRLTSRKNPRAPRPSVSSTTATTTTSSTTSATEEVTTSPSPSSSDGAQGTPKHVEDEL